MSIKLALQDKDKQFEMNFVIHMLIKLLLSDIHCMSFIISGESHEIPSCASQTEGKSFSAYCVQLSK